MADEFLSFPPNALGGESARLRVLHFGKGLLALDKPAGVAVEPHPYWQGVRDLRTALRASQGKPSFARYGLNAPSGICHLDAEVSGVALFGVDAEASALWRNAFGSRRLVFEYVFLADGKGAGETFECDLPICAHDSEPRALITHARGRKTQTRFTRLESAGGLCWWRAQTDLPRPHQIRLHAAESGLRILGEPLYGGVPVPRLSSLKPRYKKRAEEKPLYDSICAHLERVRLPSGAEIVAPLPKKLALLAEKLAQFS